MQREKSSSAVSERYKSVLSNLSKGKEAAKKDEHILHKVVKMLANYSTTDSVATTTVKTHKSSLKVYERLASESSASKLSRAAASIEKLSSKSQEKSELKRNMVAKSVLNLIRGRPEDNADSSRFQKPSVRGQPPPYRAINDQQVAAKLLTEIYKDNMRRNPKHMLRPRSPRNAWIERAHHQRKALSQQRPSRESSTKRLINEN